MQPPFVDLRLPTRDAYGIDKVSRNFSLYHGMFTFDVHESMWFVFENDTQVVNTASTGATSSDGMLKVISQGNNTLVVSRRHPRYQPNRGHLYSSSVILPDIEKDGIREWGSATLENGVFFRLNAGTLYAVRRSLGVNYEEEIELPTGADISKGCLYDIQMQWRGVGNIQFHVSHNKGTTIKHISLLGTQDTLIVANPALSMWFLAEKTTEDVTLLCGCVDLTSEGGDKEREQYTSVTATVTGLSVDTPVVAIRQPLTIGGAENTRDVRLARIRISADKKSTYGVYSTRDVSAIAATNWTQVEGSYMEVAENGEITTHAHETMRLITLIPVQANSIVELNNPAPDSIDFFIVHGEYLYIECHSGATVEATVTIELGEEI